MGNKSSENPPSKKPFNINTTNSIDNKNVIKAFIIVVIHKKEDKIDERGDFFLAKSITLLK